MPLRRAVVAALLTASAAVLTSGVLAVVLGLASRQDVMDGRDTTTLIGMLWSGTWGVRPHATGGAGTMQADLALRAWPLTLTIVTVALAVTAFRRTTRGLATSYAALAAGGAAAMTAVAMLVVGLVCHEGLPGLTQSVVTGRLGMLGRLPVVTQTITSAHARVGTPPVSGLWHAMIVLLVPLLLSLAGRAPRAAAAILTPALAGVARLLLLLPVAGLVGGVVIALTGRGTGTEMPFTLHHAQWSALVSALIAYAANAGVWLLTLGVGGHLSAGFGLTGHGLQVSEQVGGLAHQLHEPGLWVAVVLAPLVMGWATYAVVRRTRDPRSLAVWVLAVLALAPLLAWGSGLALTGSIDHLDGLLGGIPLIGLLLPRSVAIDLHLGVGAAGSLTLAAYALVAGVVLQTVPRRRASAARS